MTGTTFRRFFHQWRPQNGESSGFIQHPSVFGLVAEDDHRVVGFCFLSERDPDAQWVRS